MRRAPFHDLAELLAWLNALPPPERIHTARLLADRRTAATIGAMADGLVYEMTRAATHAEVAQQLSITPRSVRSAVTSYLRATGQRGGRGPERKDQS